MSRKLKQSPGPFVATRVSAADGTVHSAFIEDADGRILADTSRAWDEGNPIADRITPPECREGNLVLLAESFNMLKVLKVVRDYLDPAAFEKRLLAGVRNRQTTTGPLDALRAQVGISIARAEGCDASLIHDIALTEAELDGDVDEDEDGAE